MYIWQDLDLNQPINWAHPLNRGRVAWWLAVPSRYGAPSWWDLAAGYPGTFASFASGYGWNTASNPGGMGSILLSSSGSNRVDFGNRNWFYGASRCSWSFWLRINANTSGRVLSQWGSAAGTEIFLFEILSGPQFQVAFTDGSGNFFIAHTVNLTVGQWYRVIATFAGSPSAVNLYLNGQNQGSTWTITNNNTFSNLASSASTNIQLGYETNESAASASVNVSDLSFYPKRVLTAADVTADRWLSQQLYPDVLNWQFQDVLPIFPASVPTGALVRNFVYRPRFEPAFFE